MQVLNPEDEKKEILKEYRNLLKALKDHHLDAAGKKQIRDAFSMAMEAHQGMRRKSGELYIFHPVQVATICAKEIGLGKTSVVCALLHDVVEDTDITLEDIEKKFGTPIANIIDGLTKISGVVGRTNSLQAENFRKILLTLAEDVRVILIKLADRLHNMRTLDAVPRTNQLKIASETLVLFAPLAHRLGLYTIKSELEDLSLKYTEPTEYKEISQKLQDTKSKRNQFIRKFIHPIQEALDDMDIRYDIKGRPKSIYSIYHKIKKNQIPFEEIYDLFAIRIIVDSSIELEKSNCWRIYSIVTDYYTPNPSRLRDWISVPKANGYESLHTTVMGPQGKWVEVQIRSRRMDDIAEKGYAAHYKYKEDTHNESNVEEWIRQIREMLENPEISAVDWLDDFKLNLYNDEVYVFTPKGDLFTMPNNSTALDFAFEIHSQLGARCLGAKVNHKLVPLNYKIKNGDQIEILTSKKQKPSEDWLNYVITGKAKSKIKAALKNEKRRFALDGKEILMRKFRNANIAWNTINITRVAEFFKIAQIQELYFCIGTGKVDKTAIIGLLKNLERINNERNAITDNPHPLHAIAPKQKTKIPLSQIPKSKPEQIIIGDGNDLDYSFGKCCNAIPGDDIFGFITVGEGIKIHRTSCPNGIRLMSNYGYRIIKARWANDELNFQKNFLAGIKLTGIDGMGIVSEMLDIISKELQVNIKGITIGSKAGAFEGNIILEISSTEHLLDIIDKLMSIGGIDQVIRFNVDENLNTIVSQDQNAA
ncbi:MAG: RelA/SpoT family protein [Bacteroidota bacterium]|nr:RelA/SpoT family protein [Bacteroidota bacterium]